MDTLLKNVIMLKGITTKNDLCSEELLDLQNIFNAPLESREEIYRMADEKNRLYHNNRLYVRGVIELSNICNNNCKYCSMSITNKTLERYMIPKNEVIETISNWFDMGIRVFHFSSGEHKGYPECDILEILKYVNRIGAKAIIALGHKSHSELKRIKEYCPNITIIEKFETSDPWLYSEYNNKSGNLETRIAQLLDAKALGFKIGTGNIVGLPFQNNKTLLQDLFTLKTLAPEHASTSNFVNSGISEYSKYSAHNNSIENTKLFIALMRLILNERTIIPTNSSLGSKEKEKSLHLGANLVSINITPLRYLPNYVIYDKEKRKSGDLNDIHNLAYKNNLVVEFDF